MNIHNCAVTMSFRLKNLQCFLIHYCVMWTFLSYSLVLFFFFLLVVVREQGWGDGPCLSLLMHFTWFALLINPVPNHRISHFILFPIHYTQSPSRSLFLFFGKITLYPYGLSEIWINNLWFKMLHFILMMSYCICF